MRETPIWPRSCMEMGHTLTAWHDIAARRRVVRHGDNPEHVMWIDDYEIATLERPRAVSWDTLWRTYMLHKLILWTDRIHEYEAASQPAALPPRRQVI